MRASSTFVIAAAVGLAAASPAPQVLDFAALDAAPVVPDGPIDGGAIVENVTVASTVPVTTAVTPSSTGSVTVSASATAANSKRDLEKRTFGVFSPIYFFKGLQCEIFHTCDDQKSGSGDGWGIGKPSNTNTWSYITTSVPTTSATSAPVTSVPATSVSVISSGTVTTSSTACPTQIEDGTYCGFINPNDACAPQPGGYGPVPTPDTASAFLGYAPFHSMASAAPTTIPSINNTQYSQVFRDLNASVSANSYIGLYTLTSYDAAECASYCDSTNLCTAFNLYIERDPSLAPANNDNTTYTPWQTYCPDPASVTNYKCTLWGSNLASDVATNEGGYREEFQVVITGSDAWDKTNVTTPTCDVPAPASTTSAVPQPTLKPGNNCNGKAINAPSYWMGSRFIPGPFNAQVCANYALEQNEVNRQAAKKKNQKSFVPVKMHNSYFLHKNNKPYGTYCSLYGSALDNSYATYGGGKSGQDQYQCKQSWTFEFDYEKSYYSW